MKTKLQKPDLEKIEARYLAIGDLFKHLPANQINSIVTAKDDLWVYYKRDGIEGYVKNDKQIWRVLKQATMGPVRISQLNPDGTQTYLGTASTPEEVNKFLPKLPRLDKSLFAQAICELKGSLRENLQTRAELDKNDNPRADQHIEDVELVIEHLKKAIEVLSHLNRLALLNNNNQPLTHGQQTTLYILGLLVKESQ